MVQDYFSLYSKDSRYFLLRIHHKVDFADEIAWAHCWDADKENCFPQITQRICEYLSQGFDCLSEWNASDNEAWHESIKHLGFDPVLVEMELVPALIENSTAKTVKAIREEIYAAPDKFLAISIPTYVGSLYRALTSEGYACEKPRDPKAVCFIKLKDVLGADYTKIIQELNNYSAD